MSRASVRAQVAAYMAPDGVPSPVEYLSKVSPHPPRVTTADQFDLSAWGGFGVVMFIYIPDQSERRIALGPAAAAGTPGGGRKWRHYGFQLLCIFRSNKGDAATIGERHDMFLDSLTAHIQADRNFGTASAPSGVDLGPGQIFQAGEGEYPGADDIQIASLLPRSTAAGTVDITTNVRLSVIEVLDT